VLSLSDVLVVTGGIGSGKSLVTAFMAGLGWSVIDADRVGRKVLQSLHPEVAHRWPTAVTAGRVDRKRLAEIVFSDPRQLADLESLTHPGIASEIAEQSTKQQYPVAVEVSAASFLNRSDSERLVVDVERQTRWDRLLLRGMEPADIENRLASQPDRAGWLLLADYVLDNSGRIKKTESSVSSFDRFWRKHCASR
jgi:dephospho-CoA kinase